MLRLKGAKIKPQNFEKKNLEIRKKFLDLIKKKEKAGNKLKLSWSNWGFGLEPLRTSLQRLHNNKVRYVELHGNLYGSDLGYNSKEVKSLLNDFGMEVSGVCGMFSSDCELASSIPSVRQRAIDYIKRNVEFCNEVGGEYLLIVPGAVGRPKRYDGFEFDRAVEALQIIGDTFIKNSVKGAVEPIRADEVSLCHTFEDAVKLIKAVNHDGIKHINGDLYHMLHGESHIGETIINYGDYLINLHMADTTRMAFGTGMLDLDTVIMALYLIGYNDKRAFCSAEPLGAGADPYRQMYGKNDPVMLDRLVSETASYFYAREELLLSVN
ncbi:MAG: sugar phosphate isomerase/epimerase [Actinobacteria bacterium]|nr:sugar phosphate isomerase/epimerase [Actinomycetota bacterium]